MVLVIRVNVFRGAGGFSPTARGLTGTQEMGLCDMEKMATLFPALGFAVFRVYLTNLFHWKKCDIFPKYIPLTDLKWLKERIRNPSIFSLLSNFTNLKYSARILTDIPQYK